MTDPNPDTMQGTPPPEQDPARLYEIHLRSGLLRIDERESNRDVAVIDCRQIASITFEPGYDLPDLHSWPHYINLIGLLGVPIHTIVVPSDEPVVLAANLHAWLVSAWEDGRTMRTRPTGPHTAEPTGQHL